MKEVITLQFGPFANHVGAHLWSMQDEWVANRNAAADGQEGASADGDDGEFDRDVMLRHCSTHDGRREFRVPRLVLVDRQGELGVVGQRGLQFAAPFAGALDADTMASAQHAWGGQVRVNEVDIFAPHPFVSELRQEADEDMVEAGETEADEHAPGAEVDEEDGAARASGVARSARFDFGRTVAHWSDYLQLDIHPRSVHELKDFAHGYSNLEHFSQGRALLGAAAGGSEAREGAEALLDRVRRELEAADQPQGLLVLADVDSAYGGLAHGTLLAIADELGRIESVCFGLGEPAQAHAAAAAAQAQSGRPGEGDGGEEEEEEGGAKSAPRAPRLPDAVVSNRARALAAFSESASLYCPLEAPMAAAATAAGGGGGGGLGSAGAVGLIDGWPLLTGGMETRYARAAALSVAIDGLSAPCRAVRSEGHRPLPWLTSVASLTDATRICAASAEFPVLCWQPHASGAWRAGAQLCPLLGAPALRGLRAELPPISHVLCARGCEQLPPPRPHHKDDEEAGAARDERAPPSEREWNEQRQQSAWWAAPGASGGRHHCVRLGGALELPLGFPQFFAPTALNQLGGQAARAGRAAELLAMPTLTRLENTPLLCRGVQEAGRQLRAELRARAHRSDEDADDNEPLDEACELLEQVAEDYAACAQAGGSDLLEG